jgi:hypothetical protein
VNELRLRPCSSVGDTSADDDQVGE